MYKKFYRSIGRGNLVYRTNGREKFSQRVKSFDPTTMISSANNNTPSFDIPFEDEVITNTFDDFEISAKLKQNVFKKGYKIPTPIQDKSIPSIIEGRDLIGIANTGTGKTAAFLIPLIEKVDHERNHKILIVTPTRELAIQIEQEFYAFSKDLHIYSALCIGGENIKRQINDLNRNPNFVIGTPGRIIDLLRTRRLNLSEFNCVVLDEADRMVDIGFIHDIKYIVSLLPRVRQSLFFSATLDGKVQEILKSFVQNPVVVSVKTKETAQNITQNTIKIVDPHSKVEKLHEILIDPEFKKVLIFGRTKHGVQRLSDELTDRGFKASAIHGNKNQSQRVRTLERFKRNEITILVATDVASRGLDIPDVTHVINYDLPESQDAYIHRIGRTGRADKKGIALTFVQ